MLTGPKVIGLESVRASFALPTLKPSLVMLRLLIWPSRCSSGTSTLAEVTLTLTLSGPPWGVTSVKDGAVAVIVRAVPKLISASVAERLSVCVLKT